jgi:GT2 family glycosyltransferase
MIRADARLRVVLVNFNGGALLNRAVRSVIASQWPGQIDVVVVDNASSDGSLADVESLDAVTIIRRATNEGFGANNHGFSDLLGDEIEADLAPADVVALLNPDAMVAPSTFRLLAAALDEDAKIGAASPLIVFDRSFIEVHIDDGDLVINSVTTGAEELASQCHGVRGAERLPGATGPIWLCPPGSILRIPVDSLGTPVVLRVADGSARLDGTHVEGPTERALQPAARPTHRIVQNAGTFIGRRGSGINRGFTQRTSEDLGPDAPLWCGAAVVFHPDYLRAIGGFDPEYFLYYEDVDLALRGLAQGWTTVHVPEAVVEHRHSDRSVQGTELVEVLQHRNRLLTLVRHAPPADIATGFAQAALTPLSLAYSALRTPGQRAERLRLARWRARALAQAARGAGHARVARGEIDSTRVVGAADVRRLAGRDADSTD